MTKMRLKTPNASITVRSAVAAILGASAVYAMPLTASAQTQKAQSSDVLEEVTVTGSRIVRKDFESSSPIVTVGQEQLEQTSNISLEANLNKLPQFVPGLSQLVTGDIQPTATNTPGSATLNLRGLGSNRNLVIVDGRRAQPTNASLAIDINSIPSAAVERVEVITGGASSTYGADAVGGVVNFILKKNFQGLTVDAQYGQTEAGDDKETRVSAVMGANFGEGNRGNVMMGAEYYNRGDALLVDHDFYKKRYQDPTVGGTDFWWSAPNYAPGFSFANLPSQAAIDAVFPVASRPAGATVNPFGASYYLNADNTVYSSGFAIGGIGAPSPVNPYDPGGTYKYNGPIDGTFRKRTAAGGIAQNDLGAYLSTPMERWSLFGRGGYEISDNLSFFIQSTLSSSHVETRSQYSPPIGGWSVNIPYGTGRNCQTVGVINGTCQNTDTFSPTSTFITQPVGAATSFATLPTLPIYLPGGAAGLNCPALGGCTNSQAFPIASAELNTLLSSRADPNAPWLLARVADYLPVRSTINDVTTFQVISGLEGKLPIKDWTWEAYVSHGESTTNTEILGTVALDRYRMIASSPNFGKGFVQTQNGANSELINGIVGGGAFAGARVTCTSGLPLLGSGTPSQDCIDAISTPLQTRQRLTQQIYEANLQGGIVDDWAGEIRGALGASYRKNTFVYQTDGLLSVNNFEDSAAGIFPQGDSKGETSVQEYYAEAVVPLLKDIPLVQSLNLELGYRYSDFDPSGPVSTYKGLVDWKMTSYLRLRGGSQFASRAPNIGELYSGKTQLFVTNGAPTFDACSPTGTRPYGNNPTNTTNRAAVQSLCTTLMGGTQVYNAYASQANIPAGGGLYQVQGNENVKEEKATSFTAGFVLSAPFESAWIQNTMFSADYYRIKLTDAITTTSGDQIMERCFNSAINTTLSASDQWCQAMVRDPGNGNMAVTNALYSNEAAYDTAGWDFQLDWRAAMADMGMTSLPGSLSLNIQSSLLNRFEEQVDAKSPRRNWKGFLGPNLSGNTAGGGASYTYRINTTLGYNNQDWGVSLRHRFLPSIQDPNELTNPGGAPGGDPWVKPIDKYNIFDISGTWNITSKLRARAGIDNLLDTNPPITGVNLVPNNGMTGGSLTTAGAGFYDVLGRRYYVGLQANF
jgi:iron complex outermembrane recepter protein